MTERKKMGIEKLKNETYDNNGKRATAKKNHILTKQPYCSVCFAVLFNIFDLLLCHSNRFLFVDNFF